MSKFVVSFLLILGMFLPIQVFALETAAKQVILVDYDTGDILYIENRTSVTRSSNQIEDFKIVLEF